MTLGCICQLAVAVSVPVAAVDKYCGIVLPQPDIRPPGNILFMEAEPKSEAVKIPPDYDLGFCVPRLDSAHDLTALFSCEYVSQLNRGPQSDTSQVKNVIGFLNFNISASN